jgi:hypothetical protein
MKRTRNPKKVVDMHYAQKKAAGALTPAACAGFTRRSHMGPPLQKTARESGIVPQPRRTVKEDLQKKVVDMLTGICEDCPHEIERQ